MRSAKLCTFLTVSALAVSATAFSVSAENNADRGPAYKSSIVTDTKVSAAADNTDSNKTEVQYNTAELSAVTAAINAAAETSPDTAENVSEGAAAGIVLALASVVGTIVYVSGRQ